MARDGRSGNNNLQGEIWTDEDDILLAETVLRNVRAGNSVVMACREMEEKTNGKRTASASKYRWFTKLVDQYKAAYEMAKDDGEKVKEAKKRKVNKGERYKEIVEEVLDGDVPLPEKEITPDDIILLAKKFKSQQEGKSKDAHKLERELNSEKKKSADLIKQLKKKEEEFEDAMESVAIWKKNYEQIVNSLQVLKKAGINITIPEPEKTTYKVNKDGIIERT